MMRSLRIAAVAGALFSFSSAALADVPPAMDRVPTDAYVVTTIRNLEQFQSSIEGLANRIGVPAEALDQMGAARQLLRTPGLNPQGSVSIAVLDVSNGGDNFIAVIPVRDYQAFVTDIGGTGDGTDEVEIQGQTFFLKNLGDGFAAAGPRRNLVEGFEGTAGQAHAHQEFLGPTGRAIADASSVFIVANIPALAPRIREGMQQGLAQAEMMAAMMGGAPVNLKTVQEVADAFLRDATAGVVGMRAGEHGAGIDFGAQFREGSELAGYFDADGDASQLISALPNQPYLFTMGLDARSPSLRRALEFFAQAAENPEAQGFKGLNPLQALELVDGIGFLWGTTPALMGGLFLNTVTFNRTEDPQGYVNWVRQGMTAIHGEKIEGITYQTSLQEQAVGERQAHSWSVRMQVDPRHPGAQQAGQMQMMLFGPSGLSGYMAEAERGVVMTFSRNTGLLEQAVTAANARPGLHEEQGIRRVSEHLPAGRTIEAYIGVRNIMETALGFMGMMGAAPMNVELPEDLQPIGLGGTTSNGGLRMAIFVPADVMATARKLQESFEGEDDWEEDGEDTGLPRF